MGSEQKTFRNRCIASLVARGMVALCCFTPILVDLAAFTPYLDYVLLPALAVFVILTVIACRKWEKACQCPE